MSHESKRPDVAVFIDFENVYVSVRDKLDANPNFESIMDRCNDLGRVVIARAYADWYRYPRVTSALYANAIEPIYVPTYYYDKEMGRTGRAIKNSVDMNLCIDAMKTLFVHSNINRYVLVTGDRDFIPLVNSIRQQGNEVIIIGIGGAASTHLAQSADEFIFYEQLVGKAIHPSAPPQQARLTEQERLTSGSDSSSLSEPPVAESNVYDVLVEAIHLVRKRGYVSTLGSLKLVMKELMGGDFKESRYKDLNGRAFSKFKDFVLDAERRGKVQIFTNGTVNEVFLPGEDPYKLSQFAADLKSDTVDSVIDPALLGNGRSNKGTSAPPASDEADHKASATVRRRRRRSRNRQSAAQEAHTGHAQQPETPDVSPDKSYPATTDASTQTPDQIFDEIKALDDLEILANIAALREEQAPDDFAFVDWPSEFSPLTSMSFDDREPSIPDLIELLEAQEEQVEAEDASEYALEAIEAIPQPEESVPETPDSDYVSSVEPAVGPSAEAESETESEVIAEASWTAPAKATEAVDSDLPEAYADDAATVETAPASAVDIEPPADEPAVNEVSADLEAVPSDDTDEIEAEPIETTNVIEMPVSDGETVEESDNGESAAETVAEQPQSADELVAVEQLSTETVTEAEDVGEETNSDGTVTDEAAEQEADAELEAVEFSDEEWQIFRSMMEDFAKPVSFAQIFVTLRELRKQQIITRTNEQLRTMAKQAINNGTLERSGRGRRIYYRLQKTQTDELV